MPVVIQQITEHDIILARFSGYLNVDALRDMYQASHLLAEGEDGNTPVYRILDFSDIIRPTTLDIREIVEDLATSCQGNTGRFVTVLVGDDPRIRMLRDLLLRRVMAVSNGHYPVFSSIDVACRYIRLQLQREQPVSAGV